MACENGRPNCFIVGSNLAPVDGIGVDVVEIGCSFTKKGGCEGGHGCSQRGGPT